MFQIFKHGAQLCNWRNLYTSDKTLTKHGNEKSICNGDNLVLSSLVPLQLHTEGSIGGEYCVLGVLGLLYTGDVELLNSEWIH